MSDKKQQLVKYITKEMTVHEFLRDVNSFLTAYHGVSSFARSLEIAEKVIAKLEAVRDSYKAKLDAIWKSDKKDDEKNQMADLLANEKAELKLAMITKDELEMLPKFGFSVNPIFLHRIRDIVE